MITPVQNQANCGSCWAFSVVAAVEAHYAITHNGTKVSLSEQELVDCDQTSQKCVYGYLTSALEYARVSGLNSRVSYPYTAKNGSCKTMNNQKVKIDDIIGLPWRDETALRNFVFNQGPAIFIFKCPSSFQFYTGGIFTLSAQKCNEQSIGNHAMVIVGYGVENGKKYWTAKNSWGSRWGEGGYIRIERDINFCDMSSFVAPVFKQLSNITTTTTTTTTTKPGTTKFTTRSPSTCPVACGNIIPMNSSCFAKITCYGTNPSYKSTNILYGQGLNRTDVWGGPMTYGSAEVFQNLVCTPNGWAPQHFEQSPVKSIWYCIADLPPNATEHTCQRSITTPKPTTCPICPPLILGTKEGATSVSDMTNKNVACGSIGPMNPTSCISQIKCYGTNPSNNSPTVIFGQALNRTDGGGGPMAYGTKEVLYNLVCTSKGWAPQYFEQNTVKNTFYCIADLPPNSTTHICH
uniref:Peptidase C1A papain C-terminal domain-containing protein n=1 Tax=Panagrolaimus sp. ES5 TaxID=591445 RepID=A0AC34FHU6_9BILA